VAKQTTIKVRLLADIPRYGRKGSIIPIAPGRMRNFWLPSHLAEYVTNSQLQNLGHEGVVFERDFTFGLNENENEEVDVEVEQEHKPKEEIPAQIELDMIKVCFTLSLRVGKAIIMCFLACASFASLR